MVNNEHYKIAGIGKVKIKMFDGMIITFNDVSYGLDLKRSPISLSIFLFNRVQVYW